MEKTKKNKQGQIKVSRGQREKVYCRKWCDGGAGVQGKGKPARHAE